MKYLAVLFILSATFAAKAQTSSTSASKEVRKYLDKFLDIIKNNALYSDSINWIELETKVTSLSAGMNKIDECKPVIDTIMKEDYATLAKYTYPKIVELMGGRDNMIAILTKGVEEMKRQGYSFKSVSVALTPLKAKAGKEIHTIVAQTIVMGVPGGTLTSNSYLLSITADEGKTWHFVDTAQMTDMDKIKVVFPNYNPDLKIPKKDPPIFNKNQ